jgi:outer membrane protein assembly factor BamB
MTSESSHPSRTSAVLAAADAGGTALLLASIAFFANRTMAYDDSRLFGRPAVAYAAYLAAAIVVLLLFLTLYFTTGRARIAARVIAYGSVIFAAGAVATRFRIHPVSMSADDRARFAARLAAHRVTDGSGDDSAATMPSEWPLPSNVEISVDRPATGPVRVLARVVGGSRVCEIPLGRPVDPNGHMANQPVCRINTGADARRRFYRPREVAWTSPGVASAVTTEAWPQYRRDPQRSATVASADSGRLWYATLQAGARATASVVGGVVLIGTHGAGTLEAFSLSTGAARWRVWLPSWVHQDVVSDGRMAVVGFGDNRGSIDGRAPAGVAAYDLASGRAQWTKFERSSVMTSPVINDGAIVYVTAAGVLRKRRLADGALIGGTRLPGGMPMAPPVLRNDTLISSLDQNQVCASSFATMARIWCVRVPDMSYFGHSSASIVGDTIYVSGGVPAPAGGISRAFGRLVLSEAVTPVAQSIAALDMRTGTLLWRTSGFAFRRASDGHISGTATANDRFVVISLPLADRLVAFDRGTSTLRWSIDGGGARGPVLLGGDNLYLVSRDGNLRVHRALDGQLLCSIALPRHYDRGGPTLAGGSVLLASIEGDIVAVPKRQVDACDSAAVRAVFPP